MDMRFRPGTAFCRGKLYRFGITEVTVIRPWPDPRAWYLAAASEWRGVYPAVNLNADAQTIARSPKGGWGHRQAMHLLQFQQAIPPHVRDWVKVYSYDHWPLLNLFARAGRPAADLALDGCWALLLLLAYHAEVRRDRPRPRDWRCPTRRGLGTLARSRACATRWCQVPPCGLSRSFSLRGRRHRRRTLREVRRLPWMSRRGDANRPRRSPKSTSRSESRVPGLGKRQKPGSLATTVMTCPGVRAAWARRGLHGARTTSHGSSRNTSEAPGQPLADEATTSVISSSRAPRLGQGIRDRGRSVINFRRIGRIFKVGVTVFQCSGRRTGHG